ncbi:MAG: hypothetical protein ACKOYJ_08165, partial [Planctomycetia bacterium]
NQPSDGFEFRFYRGPASKGWYTESFGGEDYTVLDIHLDIRPISIAGPLYSHRHGRDSDRRSESESGDVMPSRADTPAEGVTR